MMGIYKQLFVFVEGDDDELFFDKVVELMFREKCDSIEVIQWAQERPGKTDGYIRSIKSKNWNADYILVTDMDTPCVTAKKEEIQKRFENVDEDRIMVVGKEIESWYLAVLDDDKCKEFGISPFRTTDDVTKEQFGGLVPRKFDSDIDFMREMLKAFDIETVKRKNKSFRYFVEKYAP
jgi:hypothetical protein